MYSSRTYPLPQGSVLVKSMYSDPGMNNLVGYVVMQKLASGSSASGDWYWQEVDASRNVTNSGQIQNCIGCHQAWAATDDWTAVDPQTRL